MSSNVKPLIALGLTAAGTALVANFQVSDPTLASVALPTDAQTQTAPTTNGTSGSTSGSSATSPTTTQSTSQGTTAGSATGRSGGTGTRAAATPTPTTDTSTPTTSNSGYGDGTFNGAAVREPWGTFQVQVTINGGQITAVNLVSEPRDRHSTSINNYAVPQLTQEALAVQSSDVDWISGATWTSQSYTYSLQAALDEASAAATVSQPAG
jgi:uncharacterized protein with FMN-binding domain